MQALVSSVAIAFGFFQKHCERQGDFWEADRFYKIPNWDPPLYDELLGQFNAWSKACDQLLYESARALNWFADVVRRDLNSQFFLLDGRFSMIEGGYSDLTYRSNLYEYSDKTRPGSLDALDVRVREIVAQYEALVSASRERRKKAAEQERNK